MRSDFALWEKPSQSCSGDCLVEAKHRMFGEVTSCSILQYLRHQEKSLLCFGGLCSFHNHEFLWSGSRKPECFPCPILVRTPGISQPWCWGFLCSLCPRGAGSLWREGEYQGPAWRTLGALLVRAVRGHENHPVPAAASGPIPRSKLWVGCDGL